MPGKSPPQGIRWASRLKSAKRYWVPDHTPAGANSKALGGQAEKKRGNAGLGRREGAAGTVAGSTCGADRLIFSEKLETQLVKRNLLISKCWNPVHVFKHAERTKEAPSQPRASRGHPALGGRVRPAETSRGVSGGACCNAAHWAAALCCPASRHLRGIDSEDPFSSFENEAPEPEVQAPLATRLPRSHLNPGVSQELTPK